MAASLPSALHNFSTSQTVLVKIKLKWRLQMYWTLQILWKLTGELKTCVSVTLRGTQLWISLSRSSSHLAWAPVCRIKHAEHMKGSRRTGRKAMEMSQRTCSKNPGEFTVYVGTSCRFSSQDLFSLLLVVALCSHTGMCMSQEVWLAQKGFFGPACSKKHFEACILHSDNSFMTRHAFCSCFWLSASILIDRPLCKLGEWRV